MTEVVVTRSQGILELRIDRAAKKNALTFAMYEALTEALRQAQSDASVRVAMITSSGETFCAGNDIADFLKPRDDFGAAPPSRFIEGLVAFDKPLLAAVHGPAVGIGATMLLHCDLVYASTTARLRMPFVSLGLVPEAGSSLLLPRRVGDAVAAEILLLGAWIDAERARELRLVNAVLPAGRTPRVRARPGRRAGRQPARCAPRDPSAAPRRPRRPARPHQGRGRGVRPQPDLARGQRGLHGLPRAPPAGLLEALNHRAQSSIAGESTGRREGGKEPKTRANLELPSPPFLILSPVSRSFRDRRGARSPIGSSGSNPFGRKSKVDRRQS